MQRRTLLAAALLGPIRGAAAAMPAGSEFGSGAPDGVFPRQVHHALGETTVPAAPRRIAVIATGQLDGLLRLGMVPVGAARLEDGSPVSPYLRAGYAGLLDGAAPIADLGTRVSPDIETVAQLRPDLVLMNAAVPRPELFDRLSRIAPTVATRGTGVNWKADFLLLADAVGKREAAQAVLDRFHADAAGFAERWTPGRPAPTVSFLLATGGRNRIMGVASFAGGIARDLGLRRPEDQHFTGTSRDVSLELLDQADADWLFCGSRGGGLGSLPLAPLWPTLDAVRAGRVVTVDADPFFLNAGPTAARIVLDTVVRTVGT